MTRHSSVAIRIAAALIILPLQKGCVSGGDFVTGEEIASARILATYQATLSSSLATYKLLQTNEGLAFLEVDPKGHRILAKTHWVASDGDHFVIWLEFLSRQGGAFEIVVPADRRRDALRYMYPVGAYSILTVNGVERPVPARPQDHVPVHLRRVGD